MLRFHNRPVRLRQGNRIQLIDPNPTQRLPFPAFGLSRNFADHVNVEQHGFIRLVVSDLDQRFTAQHSDADFLA